MLKNVKRVNLIMKKNKNMVFIPIYIFVGIVVIFTTFLMFREIKKENIEDILSSIWQYIAVLSTVIGLLIATLIYKLQKEDQNQINFINDYYGFKMQVIDFFELIRETQENIFSGYDEHDEILKNQSHDLNNIKKLIILDRKIIYNMNLYKYRIIKFQEFIKANNSNINFDIEDLNCKIKEIICKTDSNIKEFQIEKEKIKKNKLLGKGVNSKSNNIEFFCEENKILNEIDNKITEELKNNDKPSIINEASTNEIPKISIFLLVFLMFLIASKLYSLQKKDIFFYISNCISYGVAFMYLFFFLLKSNIYKIKENGKIDWISYLLTIALLFMGLLLLIVRLFQS